jgi:hypothetical protein
MNAIVHRRPLIRIHESTLPSVTISAEIIHFAEVYTTLQIRCWWQRPFTLSQQRFYLNLPGYDAMWSSRSSLTLRRNVMPSSSELNSKPIQYPRRRR